MNDWQRFLKKHKGQGYSTKQLGEMYRREHPKKVTGEQFTVVFRPKDPRSKAMARRITLKASGFKDAIKKPGYFATHPDATFSSERSLHDAIRRSSYWTD